MLNKVILIGNLGKDPEVRSLPSGQPVASLDDGHEPALARQERAEAGAD